MIAPKHPEHPKPMKPSELPDWARIALRAQHRAARKLRAEHKRLGLPLIVWRNGRVVREKA
ncbi:MAG: hypothetical protein RLZ97_2189 [Verrucomicrobiota bacterium]|jgi:hypothetical protein